MIIGIFTLVACLGDENYNGFVESIFECLAEVFQHGNSLTVQIFGYCCSFTGFGLFVLRIWGWVHRKAYTLFKTMGNQILEVQE